MSIALAALLAATSPTLPACSWDKPGHNPFMGDVVAAVDRYADIPAPVRTRLKQRMAERRFDEMVTIRRDAIVGQARYGSDIRAMHFGNGQVCGTVSRAKWSPEATERGLVYCEDGHCILVPTVCRNVSRITRQGPAVADGPVAPAAVAGLAGARGGVPSAGGGGTAAAAGAGAADGAAPTQTASAVAADATPAAAGAATEAGPSFAQVAASPLPPTTVAADGGAVAGLPVGDVGASTPGAPGSEGGNWGAPSFGQLLGPTLGSSVSGGTTLSSSNANQPALREPSAADLAGRDTLNDGISAGVGPAPAVPEPATNLLLLAGLGAGLLVARRRR